MEISAIVPTHNPNSERLQKTLAGLRAQTLPAHRWELVVIDNGSIPAVDLPTIALHAPANTRIIQEPKLGLAHARKAGVRAALGTFIVFVDDDNVLAPDYLEQTLAAFFRHTGVGVLGGKSIPSFETEPPAWAKEFFPLLALRDLGETELVSSATPAPGPWEYPPFAPVGAGMAVRRSAIQSWMDRTTEITDRRGQELASAGDNDIILTIMEAGWQVAYVPQLRLTHLIPKGRLDPIYLGRLNRGIQKSWIQVLRAHNVCPWPTIPRWTVPLRQLKLWVTHRAWSSVAANIRWQGARGHFEGRVRASSQHQ